MRPLIAHGHLGLGRLYRRIDKREPVREHVDAAAAMYRDMVMMYWPEQAEGERPQLQPSRNLPKQEGEQIASAAPHLLQR